MKIVLIALLFFISLPFTGSSQRQKPEPELNGRVAINSDRLEGTDRAVFKSLETALNAFVNGTQWSKATFYQNERIVRRSFQ